MSRRTKPVLALIAFTIAFVVVAVSSPAAVRVALMDFSTDDNSYRNIQTAADFTSLVQMGLLGEPGIEWVERSKISLSKQEFGLAEIKAASGVSSIRRGRMLGADWLATGHFSSDDQGRSTLSVQVIELKYADVIASDTFRLPDEGKGWSRLGKSQTAFVVGALQQLLAKARTRQQQAANQARVALLFLADMSPSVFRRGTDVLPHEFSDALERAAATNGQIKLIHFPKAYQSTDESEMMVDGIIEASQDSWSRTADLYVWGTYSTTNARVAGRLEPQLDMVLSLWDGASQPTVLRDSLKIAAGETLPPEQTSDLINRLISQILANARPQRIERDSTMIRQQIADSILKVYAGMTGRRGSELGFGDREKFAQAVHMLEAACFFDPDNADARVSWIGCRYGWWIEFGSDVKNQFWTKWRRSQAWGKYVDRFGLKPTGVELPFPYNMRGGVCSIYTGSLEEAVKMFPQWHSAEEMALEDEWRQQGVHTWLVSAELGGFPKEMPHDLVLNWRKELEAELAQRKKKVAEYSQANPDTRNAIPGKGLSRSTGAISNQTSLTPNQHPSGARPAQLSSPNGFQMVAAPEWLKKLMSVLGMFRLYPPNALPYELKPEVQKIQFPPRFEVKVIKQMAYYKGQLWILAMDERSSPSSDSTPDLSAETLDERNRLWCLDTEAVKPALFKADSLPGGISSFLFQDDQLWLAGDSVGVLDLQRNRFRKYGLADGLAMRDVEALAAAGGRIYAAGDSFKISSLDLAASRWENHPLPRTRLSHSEGTPYVLTGNDQWLGYASESVLFRQISGGDWTNVAQIYPVHCAVSDRAVFWIGAGNGLHFYDPAKHTFHSWNSPAFIESPMISMMGGGYFVGNPTIAQKHLDAMDEQIRGRLWKMEKERKQAQAANKHQKEIVDPFHMTARIPGGVAALADDGDYLWLGVGNYFGSYLLLLHKPSLSLVASFTMGVRDTISSLAVSDTYVWVGTAHGDNSLIRLRKDSFLSVSRNLWASITLTPEERERLVRNMSNRDQAMHAFFAGDDARVVQLLGGLDPKKASLEEMFVLAWSYDTSGVDDPQQARAWFQHISSQHPDSPWARVATASAKANENVYARFDRNRDGRLDESEKREMLSDKEIAGSLKSADKEFKDQILLIFKRCDTDGDQRLNPIEAGALWRTLAMYFHIGPEIHLKRRQYDTNKDSYLDAAEMQILTEDLRKAKK